MVDRAVYDRALESGHRQEYVEALYRIMTQASDDAVAICRAWESDTFGTPGNGSVSYVSHIITRAETAVRIVNTRRRQDEPI